MVPSTLPRVSVDSILVVCVSPVCVESMREERLLPVAEMFSLIA